MTDYQKYTLEEIKVHDKSILIWFRQSGKGSIIIDSIVDYITMNTNKLLYIFSNNKHSSLKIMKELNIKINSYGISNANYSNSNTHYLNSNTVKFIVLFDRILEGLDKPDFIIIDDFEYIRDIEIYSNIIDKWEPKVLLTSSQFITEVITYLDRNGDYYLSVISASSALPCSEIEERKRLIPVVGAYNVSHEYGNVVELYSGLGIEKDRKLIDIWGLKKQRRKKLEEISKKIKNEK